jgi:hypothetical protein
VAFEDADPLAWHTGTVDWGDGTTDDATIDETPADAPSGYSGTLTDSHAYSEAGTYGCTVAVTDDSGVSTSGPSFTLTVLAATVTLTDFTPSSDGSALDVSYTVTDSVDAQAAPFNISIYTSPDGSTLGTLVYSYEVSGSADLAASAAGVSHTVEIPAAATTALAGGNCYLLAEADADPTPVSFAGGIFDAGGTDYVFTNGHNVTIGNGSIDYNGQQSCSLAGVTAIQVNTAGASDTVTNNQSAAPVSIYGGVGSDATMDLEVGAFTVDDTGDLSVTYSITGPSEQSVAPFTIGIYGSPGGSSFTPTELLQTYPVTDPSLLAAGGPYTVTFAGDLGNLDTNCFLVADLDVYNDVRETTKADNVSAPLSGVFQTSDGTVYAFSAAGGAVAANGVLVSQDPTTGNVTVGVNGMNDTFASVSGVTIATPTGNNAIDGAGVTVPLTIYGGAGSDAIYGGAGGDTIYGGSAGGNTITGGAGGNTIYGGASGGNTITAGNGGDTIYGGAGGGNTITGGTGNDTIYGQGSRSNTITDTYGNNTVYAGNGGDTITVGNSEGVDDNNHVFGGAGNDRITAGNGNEWVQGGSGNEYIQGGSGNDWLFGGSGNDTIIGGTGMDYIQGGGGQNTLYGHGEHDVLDGVPSADTIHSQGSGLASDQVYDVPDYCDVQHGGVDLPTASDANANYGEYCYYTPPDPQNLSDANNRVSVPMGDYSTDSGIRLGEGQITQEAIYTRWDSSASAPAGSFWTQDAWYSIYDGSYENPILVAIVGPFNQSAPSGASGQPWTPLGTYNVTGIAWVVLSNYNPNHPTDPSNNGDGGSLFVNATMFQPLWPTVSIVPVGQIPQPTAANGSPVTPADQYQYAAWWNAWNQIQIPEDGGGDRAKVELHAAIDQLYEQSTDWQAQFSVPQGVEVWDSSQGGNQLSVDPTTGVVTGLDIQPGDFDQTVWLSANPEMVSAAVGTQPAGGTQSGAQASAQPKNVVHVKYPFQKARHTQEAVTSSVYVVPTGAKVPLGQPALSFNDQKTGGHVASAVSGQSQQNMLRVQIIGSSD